MAKMLAVLTAALNFSLKKTATFDFSLKKTSALKKKRKHVVSHAGVTLLYHPLAGLRQFSIPTGGAYANRLKKKSLKVCSSSWGTGFSKSPYSCLVEMCGNIKKTKKTLSFMSPCDINIKILHAPDDFLLWSQYLSQYGRIELMLGQRNNFTDTVDPHINGINWSSE